MILRVIWEHKSATVREVFNTLTAEQDIGYTTVLKFMQIMTDKGLLERDTSVRPQVYKAKEPRQKTQKTLLNDLIDKAFGGSPGTVALQALSMKKATPEDLQELRTLLDKLEKNA
jgi:predicted transcriptional regulator